VSRTKVSPTEWRDEGPSRSSSASVGFTIRPALNVGSMVPFSAALRQDVGPKRREQMAEQKRRSRHDFPNVERCAKRLPAVGEPCARFAGHRDSCRSRTALDNNAASRCAR
jgi:hypothetical protein